jgi:D-alanyl-D-alanine carboxypeptidase (penicillin-binding protein 5/6)
VLLGPAIPVTAATIAAYQTGEATQQSVVLFEAERTVAGKNVTLVGVVLGQQTISPITAALFGADLLVGVTFGAIGAFSPVRPEQLVGRIAAPWGASVPVAEPTSSTVVGWPGLVVAVQVHMGALSSAISGGARVGVLRVHLGGQSSDVILRASRRLPGPSAIWRLTRF